MTRPAQAPAMGGGEGRPRSPANAQAWAVGKEPRDQPMPGPGQSGKEPDSARGHCERLKGL